MVRVDIHSKVYTQDKIIGELAFNAKETEIVAIVGPSGAGKSTLLNIIAGLDKNFVGSVSLPRTKGEKPNIAYMFQEPRLLPWRTVLENVCLVGDSTPSSFQRAESLLTRVGLADQLHAYPRQLSGGMRRRASLARAFLPRPGVLLMDEPFVSLDSPSAEALRASFLELWDDCGTTVVYVTHDLAEALSVADRVLFLSASPATIILEVAVHDKRPGTSLAKSIQSLQNQLLVEHPRLLNGYS